MSMNLAATEDEAAMASRMEEHLNIVRKNEVLNEQLNQLQKDLSLAHSTIAEQVNFQPLVFLPSSCSVMHQLWSGALKEYVRHGTSHIIPLPRYMQVGV